MSVLSYSRKGVVREIWRNKASYFFLAPFLIIFFTFSILPVLTALYYSFTNFNVLEKPDFIGLDNYRELFLKDELFKKAVGNTFLLAGVIGPGGYFLSLFFAWLLNELPPKPRAVLTCIFYMPSLVGFGMVWGLMFSGDAHGLINSWLLQLGIISNPIQWLTDTTYILPVIFITSLWSSLGLGFLTFVAAFQTIDQSLYEAGAIDGVKNRWQELWYLTLPSMAPQMMFSAVMSITSAFGMGATIAGNPSPNYIAYTISMHLGDYGGVRYEMGYASAIAVFLFLLQVVTNKFVKKLISGVGK